MHFVPLLFAALAAAHESFESHELGENTEHVFASLPSASAKGASIHSFESDHEAVHYEEFKAHHKQAELKIIRAEVGEELNEIFSQASSAPSSTSTVGKIKPSSVIASASSSASVSITTLVTIRSSSTTIPSASTFPSSSAIPSSSITSIPSSLPVLSASTPSSLPSSSSSTSHETVGSIVGITVALVLSCIVASVIFYSTRKGRSVKKDDLEFATSSKPIEFATVTLKAPAPVYSDLYKYQQDTMLKTAADQEEPDASNLSERSWDISDSSSVLSSSTISTAYDSGASSENSSERSL